MKTRLIVLLAALGLLAAVAVPAYGETVRLMGTIPFDFMVGNETLPAGDYTLAATSSLAGGWWISGPAHRASLFLVTNPGDKKNPKNAPRLRFNRYGDRYFLAQIWTGAGDRFFQVRLSRIERAIAKASAARGVSTIAMR